MKKLASLLLAAAVAAASLFSCSESASGSVSTDGSTSMSSVIGALGEAFENDNPGVTFTYNPTG